MDTKEFVAKLEAFPKLRARFEEMLMIAENSDGVIELADDAEDQIAMAGHQLNHEALQAWAERQASAKAGQFEKKHRLANKDQKKTRVA